MKGGSPKMAKVEGPSGKANLEVQDTAVGRETVTVRRKVTLILPSETQASVAELMRKSGARDEAELFSIALGVLEFALWAKEQGYTVAAVNPEGRVVTEMERRKVRRLPLRLEFRDWLALGVLIGIGVFYAIVILVGLFFVRSLDDAIKLFSEVAKVLGPVAGVIVAFYYERERRIG
jgi:hypothetical protein